MEFYETTLGMNLVSKCLMHVKYTGNWIHLVMTITRPTPAATTGLLRVYLNGVTVEVRDNFNFPLKATSTNYIGRFSFSGGWNWVGNMDAMTFYPWVLGPSDVQAVMTSTSASVCLL
jgi:hypothetical protein